MIAIIHANSLHIPLANGSAHLVITSPPYYNAREEYSHWDSYSAYLADMQVVWRECFRILCNGGRIAVNVPHVYDRPGSGGCKLIEIDTTMAMLEAGFQMRGYVVWDKGAPSGTAWGSWQSASNPSLRDAHEVIIVMYKDSPGRSGGESTILRDDFLRATQSVWHIAPVSNHWHPAPFPREIPRRLISLYSYKGDVVVDPFAGSNTTAVAAHDLDRLGIGIELCWEYIKQYDHVRLSDWRNGIGRRIKPKVNTSADLPMFERKERKIK